MAKIEFSDVKLRSLPVPAKGQSAFWDAKLPSFGIRVSQGGSKTFVLNRNNTLLTIGKFGVLSLAEARTEARKLLAEFTLGKVRPQSITYPQAVQVFLEEKSTRRRARTVADHKRHLNLLGFKCQLADVTHDDLSRKLKKLPQSEFNHRLSCAKTFFTWAQKKRYVTDNPVIGLSPYSRPTRARVLTEAELKSILQVTESLGIFGLIVKLLTLTGQRKSEVASLRAEYISGDLCTLPADLTKNHREHTFPVGARTATLLNHRIQHETPKGLLFKARGKDTPFNSWSKAKTSLDKLCGVTNWTLHDLRRTFATGLSDLGTPPHIVERLLNHVSGQISGVAAIYNRAQYMPEMRSAVKKWEAKLTTILNSPA